VPPGEISVATSGGHVQPASQPAKRRRRRFTEREIKRAQRAAPDRTIIIRKDGDLELLPPVAKNDGDCAPPNPWEQEHDAT
jgi:hypothetical protein